MAESKYDLPIQVGPVIFVDMKATTTAHKGDYLCWSGGRPIIAAIEADSALTAFARPSALGVILQDHPRWTEQGSGYYSTAVPVLAGEGTIRASSVGNVSAGYYCWQHIPGSGRVGQTGATGRAPVWTSVAVAPLKSAVKTGTEIFTASAAGTSAVTGSATYYHASAVAFSALGRIVRVISAGSTGQIDVVLYSPQLIAALHGVGREA